LALVFDHRSDGPGAHALVIGVDSGEESGSGGFSASRSARRIADWLAMGNVADAPLASIDLLASHSDADKEVYFSPRTGVTHPLEQPHMDKVFRAALNWRDRLGRHADNLAFFYFVGPTIEARSIIGLETQGSGPHPALAPHLDFENLWEGLSGGPASRQLFFIDGCRSIGAKEPPRGLSRPFPSDVPESGSISRARYFGRIPPGPTKVGPKAITCLNEALLEAFSSDPEPRDAVHLTLRLDSLFKLAMKRAGFSDARPLESSVKNNFPLIITEAPFRPGERRPAKANKKAATPQSPPFIQQPEAEYQVPLQRVPLRSEPQERSSPEPQPQPAGSSAGAADPAVPEEPASEPPESASSDGEGPERDGDPTTRYGSRVALLTKGQRECLRMVYRHMETKEIARRLGISPDAVSQRIKTAMRILGVSRRRDAALILFEAELTDVEYSGREHSPRPRSADELAEVTAAAEAASPASQKAPLEPSMHLVSDDPAEVAAVLEPGSPAPKRKSPTEPNTHFVSDDPEVERDDLGRGPLAVALGRRLHRIWCRSNGVSVPDADEVEAGAEDRAAFVLHLDAPWGGGKTSFANFLARVLNPFPAGCKGPAQFLAERAGGTEAVGTIFIDDPPAAGAADPAADWPKDARRPWIVVPFNAWQAEHCAPPWWVFYQAIRKGCFRAVWAEGREASAAGQSTAPRRPSLGARLWTWAGLWAREIWWRLRNPKIMALLFTAIVAGALIFILSVTGVIFAGDDGPAFDAGNALGFLLAGVGGISGLWGLGALLTESVAPGTDAVAERRSLGGGDPFDRFRRHFSRTMKAVRRPVMVIVDDLDRCRPDFVVDLVRGIQTLLRSPRVVFVILGDRDWIERAFEAHHDAMRKVNVGAEQTFGARFVEKAIQMSFILPEMPETRQDLYVRRVLLGPGAAALGADAAPPPAELSQQLRADYRETVASAETAEDRKQAEQVLRERYQSKFQEAAEAEAEAAAPDAAPPAIPDAETAGAQADKLLGEERAMLAAVDERMGRALLHRLEPLARAFPANPRQIKRIVNAITMYTCVAYLQMDMDETDERGVELAIWVILMTEWPATWRLLAGCPDLLPAITAGKAADAKKALDAIDATLLPGSAGATLEEIMRVRADARLRALIEGNSAAGAPALTLASVREFRALTPLYAGKRKLAAGAASGETGH
jgi:DNA-binding CsgD family transcriptional regulator